MAESKRRRQYGVDLPKGDAPRSADPLGTPAAAPVRKAVEKPSGAAPLAGDDLVKAGQDLMENGA